MNTTKEVYYSTMYQLKADYYEFLAKESWEDSSLAKVSFYGSLLSRLDDFPLTDLKAKELVRKRITEILIGACDSLGVLRGLKR